MGSAVGHCCGGVVRLVGGRRREAESLLGQQEQGQKRQVRPPLLVANLEDLSRLEAQAARLRSTIERRRNVAGCSNENENVSGIIGHYEQMLLRTEQQIEELRLQQNKGAPETPPDGRHARTESGSTTCSST